MGPKARRAAGCSGILNSSNFSRARHHTHVPAVQGGVSMYYYNY